MRRGIAATVLIALSSAGLVGCAPASAGPLAVEQAFFEALHDGDGSAALALTTFDGDIGCNQLITSYDDLSFGVATSDIGDVTVSGDTATVEFTYVMTGGGDTFDVRGEHHLVLDDGSWLIEWPDEYFITATIPTDVVVELSFDGRGGADPACITPKPGDTFESIALPGVYEIKLTDPQGIFRDHVFGDLAVVSDEAAAGVDLDFFDETDRASVAASVNVDLAALVMTCASSGFTDSVCPDDLPVPGGSVTLSRYPFDRYSGSIEVTDIFSDDAENWRFTASGAEFHYLVDGVDTSFAIELSGGIVLDPGNQIAIVLD